MQPLRKLLEFEFAPDIDERLYGRDYRIGGNRESCPETLVLYRTRPTVSVQVGPGAGGARPIQLFEGSRPWVGTYAYSMGLGLGERLREQRLELEKKKGEWLRL